MRRILFFLAVPIICFYGVALAQEDAGPSVLKVKGLYIGMSKVEILAALKQIVDVGQIFYYKPTKNSRGEEDGGIGIDTTTDKDGNAIDYLKTPLRGKTRISMKGNELEFHGFTAYSDKEGNIVSITILPFLVNSLFDAQNMEASEFVQAFMQAYGIQGMKATDDGQGWFYTNPSGYKVVISTEKGLTLNKIADPKKSFN